MHNTTLACSMKLVKGSLNPILKQLIGISKPLNKD